MDCKEFEKMIPAFVANNLEYRDLKKFLKHAENCAECQEELTIQVLVSEGMVRLEEGSAFDLQRELKYRLEEAERSIRMHKTFRNVCITSVFMAILAILLVIAVFVF
ncbi:MAG: zf-HC2 domain-containing protein [Lachnospiraceae bacterium]|nr:zf-HC2 domain-containing protein [Lachnospiraceae bacterium]MBQ7781889.1 zf-HC2 domain-containing protein [Lachnospiraceae bacterium]